MPHASDAEPLVCIMPSTVGVTVRHCQPLTAPRDGLGSVPRRKRRVGGRSAMRITDVEALYLRLPEIKARTDSSQDALLIRVSTDAGITGWGEVDGCPWVVKAIVEAPMSHTLVTGLKQVLLGEDPTEIGRLWTKMYEATLYYGREGAVIR